MDRSEERKYRRAETALITAKLKVAEKVLEHRETIERLTEDLQEDGDYEGSERENILEALTEILATLKNWGVESEIYANVVAGAVKRGRAAHVGE
jgi:hypothetical protein